MTRPIKFRAWDEEHEVMIFDFKKCEHKPYLSEDGVLVRHNTYTFMQFTGLLDKNGKEIYEGDVVNCTDMNTPTVHQIVWNEKNACFEGEGNITAGMSLVDYMEIIGNIYENPELLK